MLEDWLTMDPVRIACSQKIKVPGVGMVARVGVVRGVFAARTH